DCREPRRAHPRRERRSGPGQPLCGPTPRPRTGCSRSTNARGGFMKEAPRDTHKHSASPVLLFRRVLLVEDEPRLREMLLRAIAEMGFECAGATSAEAALRLIAQRSFDTIIL